MFLFKKDKKKKKYTWSDVTIGMYKRLLEAQRDEDYSFTLVSILEGTTLDKVLNMPIGQSLECLSALAEFIRTSPKDVRMKNKYELNGKVYHISSNPTDINTAQYFDFINTPKDIPEHLSAILAIFMVPEGKEYNTGYDLKMAMYDIENHMKIEDALSVCNFFYVQFRLFIQALTNRMKMELKLARKQGVDKKKIEEATRILDTVSPLSKL